MLLAAGSRQIVAAHQSLYRAYGLTCPSQPRRNLCIGTERRISRTAHMKVHCNSALNYFATNTLARDVAATLVSLLAATSLVKTFTLLTKAGLKQAVSRKLVHITIGVVNVLTWPLWSHAPYARYFAALVPAVYSVRMLLVGTGGLKQEAFVNSITRDGQKEEVLRGPLIYVCILMVAILVYWTRSPIGTTAVAMMSGGDGAADLVGRKFGSVKLPWNKQKSWAGSLAMFVSGWGLSVAFVVLFQYLGLYECTLGTITKSLGIIAGVSALAESLPINQIVDDNIYVPLCAIAMGHHLFRRAALLV